MLKKWFLSFLLCFPSVALATPATNLEVGYSVDTHTLFLNADHPTDRDRHYIQKVVVKRNSQDTQSFYFSHQGRADKFIASLDYIANPGDHLDVDIYCSQGGVTSGSIDILTPASMREKNEQTAVSNRK